MRIPCLSDSFRNLLGSKAYVLNRALLNGQEGTQFLYRSKVKRKLCVYTFGSGTKIEIKRKYFFQLILCRFCLIGLLFVPFCVFSFIRCQG